MRVSVPASLCPLSGFYLLRPLQTDSLIRLVFAGVSACIVMSSQRILSASPGTIRFKFKPRVCGCLCLHRYVHSVDTIRFARYKQIHKFGSCLRVSVPESLFPLSGFYLLRPLQTDSIIRLVFAGVSACIVMSTQRILSASLVTNKFIN